MPVPIIDAVSPDRLEDLLQRLRRTLSARSLWSTDASRGVPGDMMDALIDRWATDYDWRDHEDRIRSLPWVERGAGRSSLRMIHRPVPSSSAPAVVLLHGWPDSVLRFERVIPLLDDFHVVVPALPGFPFAPALKEPISANGIATLIADAMAELGYQHYVVSGGDVGGTVAEIMAAAYPDRVSALHLTNLSPARAATVDRRTLPVDAVDYLDRSTQWRQKNGGFVAEQSTRPNTLIAALSDSPAGLLAWIVEKLIAWSDPIDGTSAFSPDELLTCVAAYWLTGTIGTSLSTYVQPARLPERIEVPTVFSAFGQDIMPAPRSFVETFVDLEQFVEHERGGHFAAWERPAAYAADVRLTASVAS